MYHHLNIFPSLSVSLPPRTIILRLSSISLTPYHDSLANSWYYSAGEVPVPARVVIGAGQDCIVDEEGLQETARYLRVQALQLPNLCHDVMLASDWRSAADLISKQLGKISNSL